MGACFTAIFGLHFYITNYRRKQFLGFAGTCARSTPKPPLFLSPLFRTGMLGSLMHPSGLYDVAATGFAMTEARGPHVTFLQPPIVRNIREFRSQGPLYCISSTIMLVGLD